MILVELIPKQLQDVIDEALLLRTNFPLISGFNIPDLLKYPLRSYDVAMAMSSSGLLAIPHLRLCDFTLDSLAIRCQELYQLGVQSILVISGDGAGQVDVVGMIRRIHSILPHMSIYVALDPYRQSLDAEMGYVKQKLDAGAVGVFTQPFFDMALARSFSRHCQDIPVFWGLSPVLSVASQAYWERVNRVVFPPSFSATLEWNIGFSHELIEWALEMNHHVYMMPIRLDAMEWMGHLFKRDGGASHPASPKVKPHWNPQ